MAGSTRREFLERSMFAAAAGVAGTQWCGSLALGEDKPAEAGSPSEVLRVAVLGVNSRGGEHISELLKQKNVEIAAIVDPDERVGMTKGVERIEKATGKKPAFFTDLRKCFEDKSIHCVSIATPNHWHALAAIWALQAGKHVYVEKPVSHNVSEGRRIVETARKYNLICQTGTQCRSMKGTIDAINFVHNGKIGEVKVARGLCYKSRPSIGARGEYAIPESVDYDIWAGPAEKTPLTRPKFHYDWHWQWNCGNGDLGNQGIHQMDIARWGLQANDIGQSVLSYGGRLGYEDAGETANTQVTLHNYGDKTLIFEVRGLPTDGYLGSRVGVIFHGSEGYVVLSSYTGGAAFDLDGKMTQEFKGGGDHFGNFFAAVRAGKPDGLHADIEQGHFSSALCHLGNISYRLGKSVSLAEAKEQMAALEPQPELGETLNRFTDHLKNNKVDMDAVKFNVGPLLKINPQTETFVGDRADEANPLLTREYRAPFVVPAAGQV